MTDQRLSPLARQVLVVLGDGPETAAYLHEHVLPRNTWLNRQFEPYPGTTLDELLAALGELEAAGLVEELPNRLPPPEPGTYLPPEAVGTSWRLVDAGLRANWQAFKDLGGPEALWDGDEELIADYEHRYGTQP